jgi:uncharacterized membrane protein
MVCALAGGARAAGPEEPRATPEPATTTPPPTGPATTAPPSGSTPSTAPTALPPPQPTVAVSATGSREIEEVVPNPPKSRAIIIGSVAGGCFLLGAVLGGVAFARAQEQSGDATNPQLYTAELAAKAGEGKALAISAYVFFAVGGALAIADAILWVETLRKPRTIKRTATRPRSIALQLLSSDGVRF